QHVHVAGHPAGDGMDRVRHVDAARLEHVGEGAHVVLRLRDGHTVPGDDHDLVRVREHHGDVVGGRGTNRAVCRGGPRSPPCVAAPPAATWPNAPKSTLPIARFMARLIIIVSSVPDAPTSIPLTMSTLFDSSNPVAAAARPVKALSSEITTGMSAPPIGSTKRT